VASALPQGLGGWTLSAVHDYDRVGKMVIRGDGRIQGAGVVDSHVISTRALTGWPVAIAAASDGSVYTAEDLWVKKTDPIGHVTVIAGGGSCSGPQSGVPATQVCLHAVYDLALGIDGSLYLAGDVAPGAAPIQRIRPDGIIEDFAGVSSEWYANAPVGDEGPALQARIASGPSLAAAPDGSVYVLAENRIRRVSTDGMIHAYAGTGTMCLTGGGVSTCCDSGDAGPASAARLCGGGRSGKIAVGPDGSVYLGEESFHVVRRIRPDGIIERFAGSTAGYGGDGGSARAAQLYGVSGVSAAVDGAVYVAERGNGTIRRIAPSGIIETVAGKRYDWTAPPFSGDGGPALAAQLNQPLGAVTSPSGELFIADTFNGRVRSVGAPLPGFTLAEFVVASDDGTELYVFSPEGRHLRTLDARTKALVYSFGRDAAGRIIAVTDRGGNTTRIERAGDRPTAIVSPYGQRTTLSIDGSGYLSAIQNPAGEVRGFGYDANGLMATHTDPRGFVHRFFHDGVGRLARDENPAGGFKTLARSERDGGFAVLIETALGQTTVHDVAKTATGDEVRTSTLPDGTVSTRRAYSSGLQTTSAADGSSSSVTYGPDPQFEMQSPLVASAQVRTPSGLTLSGSRSASVTLSGSDSLNVLTRTEERTVNGRTARTTYDAAAGTVTTVSAGGRTVVATLDDKGRVTKLAPPGVLPVAFQYDANGRLWTTTQGARSFTIEYDGGGLVQSVTDSLSRRTSFTYDGAGRALTQTLPGNRTVGFGYDASGNMTSLAPPGRPAHGFGYTSIDQVQSYDPPVIPGAGTTSTTYDFDADGRIFQELFPDSESLVATWETGANGKATGRLAGLTTAYGTTRFGYDGAGRVQTIATPNVVLGYGYDGFLPTSETWAGDVSGAVGYTYDSDFRVSGVTINGTSTARSYDADGLLTGVGALGIVRETATGLISTTTLGAIGTSQTYDSYGSIATFSASVSGADQYRYELMPDAAGRIATKKETIAGATHTTDYGYDDAGRLWTVRQDGVLTATYEYDANGNRTRKTAGGASEEGSYDAQDRMLSYGGASYTWRPNGELESRTVAGQTTWYAYDRIGNLRQVSLPDGRSIEYVVDGLNRRVGKKVNGALVEGFLYEGKLRPVAWLDGAGAVRATFVYGTRVNVPEYMVTASGTFRIITDHLGSPRLVVDANSGTIAQRIDYDEWGLVLADSNPGFQPFGFAGGLYDRDAGLVRFGARDYDLSTGRWTNKDPVRFRGGLNLYAYVDNDPVNFVDPSGRWLLQVGAALIGGAIGGVSAYLNNGSTAQIIGSVFAGAGAGLLASFGATPGAAALWGAVGASSGNLLSQLIMNKRDECGGSEPIDWSRVWLSGMFGLATGGFGPGIAEETGTEVATLVVAGITGTLDAMTPNWILYQNAPQQ
jgi:RHS repeat-associated protein